MWGHLTKCQFCRSSRPMATSCRAIQLDLEAFQADAKAVHWDESSGKTAIDDCFLIDPREFDRVMTAKSFFGRQCPRDTMHDAAASPGCGRGFFCEKLIQYLARQILALLHRKTTPRTIVDGRLDKSHVVGIESEGKIGLNQLARRTVPLGRPAQCRHQANCHLTHCPPADRLPKCDDPKLKRRRAPPIQPLFRHSAPSSGLWPHMVD